MAIREPLNANRENGAFVTLGYRGRRVVQAGLLSRGAGATAPVSWSWDGATGV